MHDGPQQLGGSLSAVNPRKLKTRWVCRAVESDVEILKEAEATQNSPNRKIWTKTSANANHFTTDHKLNGVIVNGHLMAPDSPSHTLLDATLYVDTDCVPNVAME